MWLKVRISEKTREKEREPLIIPGPNVYPHNHTQQNRPGQNRPDPPPIPLLVQKQSNHHTPDNLGDPIDGIVQGPALDVKQDGVVLAELPGVEIVAGEEHGKEEYDEWICSERDPEAFEFCFP